MHGDGVEAVIDRDVTGKSIVDSLLCLDRDDRSPSGHRDCPFNRMDADIGAAVDRHDASSMNSTTGFDQLQREFNLDGIERPCFEQLVAYPRARMGSAHAVVEPVGDHRAVIGCGQHEGKLASDIAHEISSAGTQYDAGSNRITDKINAWRYFRHGPLGRFGRNCSSYSAFPCEFTQGAIQW